MRTAIPRNPDESPESDWAIRCTVCAVDWPPDPRLFDLSRALVPADKETLPCPVCETLCSMAANLDPIDWHEAWSLKNHADFDRYYEKRGERDVLTEADLAKFAVDS